MSMLTVYNLDASPVSSTTHDHAAIRDLLDQAGVLFEQWDTLSGHAQPSISDASILEAYSDQTARLKKRYGFQSADVIHMQADHPQKEAIRARFLSEHTHSDFEVRFFVEGRGLFYLRHEDKIYALLCEKGDLISVPAGMPHWFDMGSQPHLSCIRLFTDEAGWVAAYTGTPYCKNFPDLDQTLQET